MSNFIKPNSSAPPSNSNSNDSSNSNNPTASASSKSATDIHTIGIPQHLVENEIVYYVVTVASNQFSWSAKKRFSQFEILHSALTDSFPLKTFPAGAELPGKRPKLLVSHTNEQFIEERRCLLEAYIRKLLSVPMISRSEVFLSWLREDKLPRLIPIPEAKVDELPEDAEITHVDIPSTRTMSDHVLYQIDVSNVRKRKSFQRWTVLKRFGQVYEMDAQLRADIGENQSLLDLLPHPPAKQSKIFIDHLEDSFIEHRRLLLENYLRKLIHIPIAARNKHFLNFLGVQV